MADRRTVLTAIGATVAASAIGRTAGAQAKQRIAILGTGNLGQALASCWARAGHPIVFGSRTPDDKRVRDLIRDISGPVSAVTPAEAAAQADIVVSALPWEPAKELLRAVGDLTGKIVIDPMNAPLKLVDRYPAPRDTPISVAEELQALLPGAKVVKAFNTPTSKSIVDPRRAGGHVSIPLAGADVAAKSRVAALVSEIGLEPVDCGPLVAARYIEAMLLLASGYVIYTRGKLFEFHLAPVS
jgi:predicted dinucleotide-binding enzyme